MTYPLSWHFCWTKWTKLFYFILTDPSALDFVGPPDISLPEDILECCYASLVFLHRCLCSFFIHWRKSKKMCTLDVVGESKKRKRKTRQHHQAWRRNHERNFLHWREVFLKPNPFNVLSCQRRRVKWEKRKQRRGKQESSIKMKWEDIAKTFEEPSGPDHLVFFLSLSS